MLEVKDITIKYDVCEVIQNISFALKPGKIVAVLGANGAGKTTLLRALNGAISLAKGEILLDGKGLEKYSRREAAQKFRSSRRKMKRNFRSRFQNLCWREDLRTAAFSAGKASRI